MIINKYKIINYGNFLDFLEFSLFSSLLPLISRDLINNQGNTSETASLAYLLFYIGFLGRPLGAIIFGYFGDKYGRKRALVFSLSGMSLSTFLIGVIPNFMYAYILIAMVRFTQGIFTGGEYSNATVYVIENVSSKMRFRNAANLTASGIFGACIGQIIGMVLLSGFVPFISWRYVFIFISIIGIYVSVVRLYNIEEKSISEKKVTSFREIKKFFHSRYVVMGVVFGGLMNGLFYLIYTFMGTYSSIIKDKFEFSSYFMSLISSLMLAGALVFWSRSPVVLKYDSSSIIKLSILIMLLLIYPMYVNLSSANMSALTFLIIIVFVSFMQLFTLMVIKTIPENIPVNCRVLLSGFPISLGGAVLGGVSPYVSSKLILSTGNDTSPVLYFTVLMLIALFVITFWPLKKSGEHHDTIYEASR